MKDTELIKLRPKLNLEVKDSNEMEAFQNTTLRPILKLQHDTTFKLLQQSTHYKKAIQKVDQSNTDGLNEFIKKYISTNNRLRQMILGTIIGMMTQAELEFYSNHNSEVNKRILSMQVKRYTDTIS